MMTRQEFNKQSLTQTILTQKWPSQSNTIYYVSLYKESQTGLLFNQRMLVIEDKTYTVFYTKYYKPLPILLDLQKKGTVTIKERLLIMGSTVNIQHNLITIDFFNTSKQKKSWIFKFISNQLAAKWVYLFHELQEQYMSKFYKTKGTKSTGIVSQFNSILSKLRYGHQIQEEIKQEEDEHEEVSIKKEKYFFQ